MNTRRLISMTLAMLCASLGGLALSGGSAWASGRMVVLSSFDGSSSGTAFAFPTGIAVDRSSPAVAGNVLVADGTPDELIDVLGASGGLPLGVTVPHFSHGFNFGDEAIGVAVDNSGGPSNGDVYVADSKNFTVDKFALNASGEYEFLCVITGVGSGCNAVAGTATQPFGELEGLALDAHGNVYVSDYTHQVIDEFSPSAGDVRQIRGTGAVALGTPSGLAFDAQGDLFVQQYGGGAVLKFAANPAGEVESSEAQVIDPAGAVGVAVDPHSDTVYVAQSSSVLTYTAAGVPEGEAAAGELSSAGGIAVDPATGTLYVSDDGALRVDVVGVPPVVAPTIASASVASVTSTSADLQGEVNPNHFATSYQFQYVSDADYQAGGYAAAKSVPVAAGGLGSGGGASGVQTVANHIQGLAPDTLYHYRLLAASTNGTREVSHTFVTQEAAVAPLPDDRGYEMVSPIEKGGGRIYGIEDIASGGVVQAAADGDSIAYVSIGSFGEAHGAAIGTNYIATRNAEGWASTNISAPQNSGTYPNVGEGVPYKAFSEDLSTALLLNGEAGAGTSYGEAEGVENPPLPGSEAPVGYENYYLRNTATQGYQALLRNAPSVSPESFRLKFRGASEDLKHIVVSSPAALTPEALPNSGENLYEWSEGRLEPVNVLPGAAQSTSSEQASLGADGSPDTIHAVSEDGSRVFWTRGPDLYVRVDGVRTLQVDASQGPGQSGGGVFKGAAADGSKVLFTDESQLTPDSTAGGVGSARADLYQFDVNTGRLVDLTVDRSSDPDGAEVQGVLGESASGASVYFVARGVLSGGNAAGKEPLDGQDNLYVWHDDGTPEGARTFIATLSEDDQSGGTTNKTIRAYDWSSSAQARTARVTADGEDLVFMATESLTGYDNHGSRCVPIISAGVQSITALAPGNCPEVYLYAADAEKLVCVSCNPSGARPDGPSFIPGGTPYEDGVAVYQSRVLSVDPDHRARVFFNSYDALVSGDSNSQRDVYEWEDDGRGGCAHSGGCVSLISSGTSTEASTFLDASSSGDDVFFLTASSLVPQDPGTIDLYDARVDGGVSPGLAPPACSGTGCQGLPSAPVVFSTPASVTFAGVGNFAPSKPKATKTKAKPRKSKAKPKKAKAKAKAKGKSRKHKRAKNGARKRKRGSVSTRSVGRSNKGRR